MRVPWIDLPAQYGSIKAEIDASLQRVCAQAAFVLGPEVAAFERAWADYCGAKHCVAVNSGTAALHAALIALGVGEGDEVIPSPLRFFATCETILYVGARPVFADVDPDTYNVDPAVLESFITDRTRAIMPVHLAGHPADMDPIMDLARRRGIAVLADACQAHGALYKGRKVGALGDAGTFSFYVTKNLGAYGEGGAVVTDSNEVAEQVRLLRAHGQNGPYRHAVVGYNYRMTGFQGAVLNVKLAHLDKWNARRREIAERYTDALAGTPVQVPQPADYATPVWHLYITRVPDRDALQQHLREADVATAVHYPVLMPDLQALRDLGIARPELPVAEKAAGEVLSLPLFPEMTDEQVDYVIEQVRAFF